MVKNAFILFSISHRVGQNQKHAQKKRSLFPFPVALHSPTKSTLMGWWREHALYQSFTLFSFSWCHPQDHFGTLMSHYNSYQTIFVPCVHRRICLYMSVCMLKPLWTHAGIKLSLQNLGDSTDLLVIYFSPTFALCSPCFLLCVVDSGL